MSDYEDAFHEGYRTAMEHAAGLVRDLEAGLTADGRVASELGERLAGLRRALGRLVRDNAARVA